MRWWGMARGKYEDIQDLFCQACRKKFTVRRHTVLYRLKTHSKTIRLVLNLLALGVDLSALEEAIEIRESTMRVWLTRSGEHGRKLHERYFRALDLIHIQLDELWANVKQTQQDMWVWVACDAKTKIVPVIQVGGRTQEMAYAVVHELKSKMKAGCVPIFSSDGLKHYYYALTAHYGEWVCPDGEAKAVWMILPSFFYGQVIKHRKRHRVVEVEQRMIWGLAAEYRTLLKASGMSGKINTAFVERINLTIRQCVSKLTRRTWGTAQFTPELSDHLTGGWRIIIFHAIKVPVRVREPADQIGRTDTAQGQAATKRIQEGYPGGSSWTDQLALVSHGAD